VRVLAYGSDEAPAERAGSVGFGERLDSVESRLAEAASVGDILRLRADVGQLRAEIETDAARIKRQIDAACRDARAGARSDERWFRRVEVAHKARREEQARVVALFTRIKARHADIAQRRGDADAHGRQQAALFAVARWVHGLGCDAPADIQQALADIASVQGHDWATR
jgi:hypothetical protein